MISLNWVKDYIDLDGIDLKQLAVKVTKAGINVNQSNTKLRAMFEELGDTGSNVGKILEEKSANSRVLIEIKNKLSVGDTLELIIPNEIKPQAFTIEKLYDSENSEEINTVNPGKQGQTVILEIPFEVKKGWILRRKK